MKTLLRILLASVALAASAADTSITALPAIGTVTTSTVLPVVDMSGTPTTKKATAAQLINGLPVATGSTVGTMSAADKTKLDAATDANTASAIVRRDATGNFVAGTITAAAVTGLANPVNGTDAANKSYVDASSAGLVIKSPVRAATISSNVTLVGGAPNTLDSVTLALNDRILVKNQTDGKENGIYYVTTLGTGSNGTWTRSTDADTSAELVTGSYTFITGGTTNANAAYTMVTPAPITLGTSIITWNLFSQVTQILASNILGQIVGAQIADSAINTAKFAAGLTPVEILGTLPVSGNFAGRQVFLTTTSKLYRYNGSAFTAATPTTDLTGQIAAGQVAANAITAGTIAANAVTAGTIQAGAVNTTELAAGAITTAKIYAGAVDTNALAANSITGTKIQAGTITTDKITAANLAAISANLGTITAGSLTASSSVTVGSGMSAVSITSSGQTIGGGRISFVADGANPRQLVSGNGTYSTSGIQISGANDPLPPFLTVFNGSGNVVNITPTGGIALAQSAPIRFGAGSRMEKNTSDNWTPPMWDGSNSIEFQWDGGLKVRIDGSTVLNIATTP
jgi:hypothetical protein